MLSSEMQSVVILPDTAGEGQGNFGPVQTRSA